MAAKKHRLLVALALLVLVAMGSAVLGCGGAASEGDSSKGSDEDVVLQYTFKAGDTWTHELTTVIKGSVEGASDEDSTIDETTKSKITSSVTAVTEDGVATVEVTTEILEMTSNGTAADITGQEPQKITMTVDKTGKVLSVEGPDDSEAAYAFMATGMPFDFTDLSGQFSNLIYPSDGTAKVGEEWESTLTMPLTGMDQEIAASTKATLVAVSTEEGRETATIDYTITLPMDLTLDLGAMLKAMMEGFGGEEMSGEELDFVMTLKGDMRLPGTAKVARATGQVISMNSDGTMAMEMAITEAPEDMVPAGERGPFEMNLTMTMTQTEVR
ncbi:MAG: hypothetical protein JXA87_06540 [Thermoleophilia bacterium]|nr:hypothetical protein [Thermoleophilia bacterium]